MRVAAGAEISLRGLRVRIERWRMTRSAQGPMPEPLWNEAAEAARSFGVSRVSTELKIGYAGLRRRVAGLGAPRRQSAQEAEPSGRFVEVTGAQLLAAAGGNNGTVIEYLARDGARMTVTIPVGSGVDVSSLVAALRGP